MKRIIIYTIIGALFALSASSCKDTLDTHPTATFDNDLVWGSKSTAEAFINATYSDVLTWGYVGSGSCVTWESRTPNSVRCSQVWEGIDHFATELGLTRDSNYGPNRSGVLRRCNKIIEEVAQSTFLNDAEKKELSAHGHFLRGLVFFDMTRKMGRILPITETFNPEDTTAVRNVSITANTEESYKYVLADLEVAAKDLPKENRIGLPTKWAAEVILSRAYLQAYAYTNNESYIDKAIAAAKNVISHSGVSLSNSQGMFNEMDDMNSEILWGYYRLEEDTKIGGYDELIRTYPNISRDDVITSSGNPFKNANGQTFEGWAIHFPTQDLVDQFLVIDQKTGEALPWYETSQYRDNVVELDGTTITEVGQVDQYERKNGEGRRIPSDQDFKQINEGHPHFARYAKLKDGAEIDNISQIMYENRDRRFYTAVVYDQAKWIGETIETNLGGNASQGVRDKEDGGWYNTVTGYYWRKSNIENPDPRAYYDCKVALHYNIVRLGEAYLNLAEAYLLKKDIANAVKALNETRTIHGGLPASKATTEKEAWADYIRERNVELTNEGGDLYYSYLRWGKYGGYANHGRTPGDIVYDLDRPVYKIQISRDRTKFLVSQVTLMGSANRNFTTKRYLLPIAQGFLNTREAYGLDAIQNEGW